MRLTILRHLLGAAVALMLAIPVAAQVLPETLFTVGTTWRDSQNRDWSYLSLQPAEPAQLMARKLAVYGKSGDANSTQPYERRAILAVQTDPSILAALLWMHRQPSGGGTAASGDGDLRSSSGLDPRIW